MQETLETQVQSLDREDPLEKWVAWQLTPVFFSLENLDGQGSLGGYSPWDHKILGHE